jgi:aspartyl protease family protein
MSVSTIPEWQQLALYAVGAALALVVLFNIPFLGRIFRSLFSVAILAFMVFVLLQQAPYDPILSRWTERLGLSTQQVVGNEVRIRLASDGHFWARVEINGTEQRMMIDSGATITALSAETARQAGVGKELAIAPVIEGIEARNLKVVISPAFGGTSVLGMNFLSQLASWRVEKDTLVLVPAEAQ